MVKEKQRLIEKLVDALVVTRKITQADSLILQESFRRTSGERFEDFLLEEQIIPKADLLHALEACYGIPALDVTGLLLDHHLVRMFPKEIMLQYGFVPYAVDGDVLQVIASRPDDGELLTLIGEYVSYDVVFRVGLYQDISDGVKEFYDEALTIVPDDGGDEDEEIDFSHEVEDSVDEF